LPALSLLDLITFFLPFITFYLGAQKEKGQNKKELILKFYPDLIGEFEDFNSGNEKLLDGTFDGDIRSLFDGLLSMDKDSTLSIIENIDKALTKPLRKIIDDLIPSFGKIDESRQRKYKEMSSLWINAYSKILEDYPDGITKKRQLDKRKFMNQVYDGIKWDLWRNDSNATNRKFKEIVDGMNNAVANVISPDLANQFYTEFTDIFDKEMGPIRDDIIKTGTSLKSVVCEEILPIMIARMRTVGK